MYTRDINKICKFDQCDKPYYAMGYCQGHYRQDRRGRQLARLRGAIINGQKVCSKCKEDKPLEDYYMNNGRPRSRCKVCLAEDARERRNG